MKALKIAMAAALVSLCTIGLTGCDSDSEEPNFSNYRSIAELATVECYYHNVAEIYNKGDDLLFGFVNKGYKKAWFEYEGSVQLGVDVSQVKISEPDANGVVTIHVPEAQVVGQAMVDENSFSDVYADNGIFSPVNLTDMAEAYATAQEKMRKAAESDTRLAEHAQARAKALLEQYVINVGNAAGKSYTVRFA